ncbi:MAG TPA: S8 family serine peptidase [Streptosporangiaceae bacterium]|nr:S8 family serine peptidase [Streptosporangiaceae bacterium]
MFDQEARLERLLARHRDAHLVEPVAGRPALVRRDQLLVADRDVPTVEDLVRRWYDSRHDEAGVSLIRLRAPARVDVCELAAELSGEGRHRRLTIAPNHLVYGQPMWWSGPADLPRPAPPLPPPGSATPAGSAAPAGSTRSGAMAEETPVTVAVLDTGLSPHPWYETTDWYTEQRDEAIEVLDADDDYELDAQAGHGTFIAGVILQRAPTARIRARRVIGGDGVGDELAIIKALTWLAGRGEADVVNLSLGCHTYDDRPSPLVARAIAALGRTTVVVACAGNAATDRPFWPAALKTVIAVAALDGGERAWFSNYGWWVDACAPGVGVASCFIRFDGPRPPAGGLDPDEFQGYATWSGTSFAAPAVAGAIAGLAVREGLPVMIAADLVLDPAVARSLPDLGIVVT